nr:hypothetical protein [Tanacetum cinerariifolium]
MVIHTEKTEMMRLVVEIEYVDKIADVFDKATGLFDGLQPEQVDLNYVHALNEPRLHDIHVVLSIGMERHDSFWITWEAESKGDQTPPSRDESFDSDSEPEAEEADDELEAEEANDELEVEEAGVEPEAEGADVELEVEEPDGVSEATIRTSSQRPFDVRDFPMGFYETGESSTACDPQFVGGLAPWALRHDLEALRRHERIREAESETSRTEVAFLGSKAKIGKMEREILHYDLSSVEETLGKVVERLKVLESEENATLRKKLAEKEVLLDLTRASGSGGAGGSGGVGGNADGTGVRGAGLTPTTINDAVRLAYQLARQLIQDKADEATEGEKRKGEGDRGGRGENRREHNRHQNQRRGNAGAMINAAPNNNETCQKYKNKRHAGDCWKCTKCGKLGHKTKRCRTSEMSCYKCNKKGHRKRDCPKLGRNGQGGNNCRARPEPNILLRANLGVLHIKCHPLPFNGTEGALIQDKADEATEGEKRKGKGDRGSRGDNRREHNCR